MRNAMVAGASGLIGTALVKRLLDEPAYTRVDILVRKKIPLDHPKLAQHVWDFENPGGLPPDLKVTDAFCTLGTTISRAGSKPAFERVDREYVSQFATMAKELGATGLLVVSSMGADSKSSIFYNKVKGCMEEDLKTIGFPRLAIFRPSLLLGPRTEKRAGEKMATWVMKAFDFAIPSKFKAIHVDKVARKMVETALKEEDGNYILESDRLH